MAGPLVRGCVLGPGAQGEVDFEVKSTVVPDVAVAVDVAVDVDMAVDVGLGPIETSPRTGGQMGPTL